MAANSEQQDRHVKAVVHSATLHTRILEAVILIVHTLELSKH